MEPFRVYVDDLKVVATKLELINGVETLMKERFGDGLTNCIHSNVFIKESTESMDTCTEEEIIMEPL